MKILITGGLGYVGGRLASFLNEKGDHEVFLSTRNRNKNLPDWVQESNVLQMDLADKKSIKSCVRQVQPDTIIHLGVINQQEPYIYH